MQGQVVLFFDGICHLCNGVVDEVIKRDQGKTFVFAPLQGETAKMYLEPALREDLKTVVVYIPGKPLLLRSDAILFILSHLPGFRWTRIFQLLPRGLRDLAYAVVARSRYRWFGQRETCRIPNANERHLLLP